MDKNSISEKGKKPLILPEMVTQKEPGHMTKRAIQLGVSLGYDLA